MKKKGKSWVKQKIFWEALDDEAEQNLCDKFCETKQELECLLNDGSENEMKNIFFRFVQESLTRSMKLFVNLYAELFAKEKSNRITKEMVEESINLIIENPSKWIFFIWLPSTIHGYTSPFLHIYREELFRAKGNGSCLSYSCIYQPTS